MTLRIPAIRRWPARTDPRQHVHFHLYADGRPYVCDLDRCDSPALSEGELAPRHRCDHA